MKLFRVVLGVLLCALLATPALAQTRGTKDEAKALVEKGIALLKAEGEEKALAKFMDKEGGFVDRDLYLFVVDAQGMVKANVMKPVLVGKSGLIIKDATGKSFIQDFIDVKETAWVEYKWLDPLDNTIKAKESYVVRVGDLAIGAGYYKE